MVHKYFICPDFMFGTPTYDTLSYFYQNNPEIFYEGRSIYSVFGAYPGMIWMGGGSFLTGNIISAEQMKEALDFYNNNCGIRITYTFTNPLLEEKHLYDTYCNKALEVLSKTSGNAVLVSSELLENYIRKYYPSIAICKSIIGTENKNYFPDEKYALTVMRRSCNMDIDFLKNIPQEHKKKIELLCTDPCPDNCPRIYDHYKAYANSVLSFSHNIPGVECSMDSRKGNFEKHFRNTQLKTFISPEKVNELSDMGYRFFKLSGRGSIPTIVENNLEYLIKPEYQRDLREIIYAKYLKNN